RICLAKKSCPPLTQERSTSQSRCGFRLALTSLFVTQTRSSTIHVVSRLPHFSDVRCKPDNLVPNSFRVVVSSALKEGDQTREVSTSSCKSCGLLLSHRLLEILWFR